MSYVFPAYAGVFPKGGILFRRQRGLPRIRGGVSVWVCPCSLKSTSSPHTRGCFLLSPRDCVPALVFPAYAGVFPAFSPMPGESSCLPRIRGGVSLKSSSSGIAIWSSPHTRGCFYSGGKYDAIKYVFPAYAGVFPPPAAPCVPGTGLPRIRGGVSASQGSVSTAFQSSPHTRGCFPRSSTKTQGPVVFPAYAGVFLAITCRASWGSSLPRIRVGVSQR